MNIIESLIVAVVEGITEFLPISSTAHMRITENLLGLDNKDVYTKIFTISIQLGAILSVVVLYWKKFFDFTRIKFYLKLGVAVIPALIFGYLFNEQIEKILEKPLIIAIIMLLGGVVFLFIDRFFNQQVIDREEDVDFFTAFKVGLFQCLAILLPGLSRSAATILGGMSQKISRKVAAEFSFFLAVPTMMAATLYSLFLKNWETDSNGNAVHGIQKIMESTQNTTAFLVGNLVAFAVAMVAIRFFIQSLQKYGFKIWGYYRILIGIAIIILLATGVLQN